MTKKKISPNLLALSAALLMGGCSMIPTYERPAAPVADAFPSYASTTPLALGASPNAPPAASVAWQDFFSDARLKSLIEQSLANNRDLRVAVLNIEQARAQYQIRRADQLPTVNGVLTGSRAPGVNGATTSLYNVGLAVTAYELDFFGRVASLKESALAQYLATEEGRKTVQISLISAVANSYLSVLADEELLDITLQTLATRQESVRLSRLRFDSGVTSELDFQQAESLLQAAQVAYAQQRQRALDENALTLLVGQPLTPGVLPSAAAGQTVALAQFSPMLDVPAGLPSGLLVNRPDIRQAEQQLLAANANIGAARAAFFPRISLTVGAGSASSHLSELTKSGSWGWTLAPQLLLPIFDSGRNIAGLDSAKVGRDIAVVKPTPRRCASSSQTCATRTAFPATSICSTRSVRCLRRAKPWCRPGWPSCKARSRCTRRWVAAGKSRCPMRRPSSRPSHQRAEQDDLVFSADSVPAIFCHHQRLLHCLHQQHLCHPETAQKAGDKPRVEAIRAILGVMLKASTGAVFTSCQMSYPQRNPQQMGVNLAVYSALSVQNGLAAGANPKNALTAPIGPKPQRLAGLHRAMRAPAKCPANALNRLLRKMPVFYSCPAKPIGARLLRLIQRLVHKAIHSLWA